MKSRTFAGRPRARFHEGLPIAEIWLTEATASRDRKCTKDVLRSIDGPFKDYDTEVGKIVRDAGFKEAGFNARDLAVVPLAFAEVAESGEYVPANSLSFEPP